MFDSPLEMLADLRKDSDAYRVIVKAIEAMNFGFPIDGVS